MDGPEEGSDPALDPPARSRTVCARWTLGPVVHERRLGGDRELHDDHTASADVFTECHLHDREIIPLPPTHADEGFDTANPDWETPLKGLGEPPWQEYVVTRYLSKKDADGPMCVAPSIR